MMTIRVYAINQCVTLACVRSISEIPNSNSIVSRIELQHVMNTYTNYQPNTVNNPMNMLINSNHHPNNNGFFAPMGDTNNPDYDFAQHFSMGHFMPTTMHNRPFMPARPMMPFPPIVNDVMTTTDGHPSFPLETTTTPPPRPMPTAIDSNIDSSNDICGTRYPSGEVTPLVFGGEETKRGNQFEPILLNESLTQFSFVI